ncbi:ABC transporter ATP-binding protein [uncultured Thiodictyon sp.]|jgi:lipopolysaccharide transport system ATP-binding protein|uniref:ABC transporter ATP-binding protein n=1 Tax=uncultured Thiodictyon sp. TaxID=1846217 RepID=UPI0025DE5A25|nr:ABC transporter ATP-binding protein [uncultured Thiodictyon sp.]
MSDIAISVENLSKSYVVGHNAAKTERYTALRDVLALNVRNLARKTSDMIHGRAIVQGDEFEEFWALQDVSFQVKCGDVVGIIGRNGAGKSTILKILSRITEPTKGRIVINGRVSSLLEVGTGFHPELTGRENIFLNGAILGMSRSEIRRKFDEIVAFAEVDRFLDTPVKRFSSGMYVRLAFAVAAHLEPEILLVDEVLAVGDSEFQKKCLGKMNEISTEGRTVFFVSHNMGMITSLCKTALLLEKGAIIHRGAATETVTFYYTGGNHSPHVADFTQGPRKLGDDLATLLEASVEDTEGKPVSEVDIRVPFRIRMRYELHTQTAQPPYPNFHFFSEGGQPAFVANSTCNPQAVAAPGIYDAFCDIPGRLLNNGCYFIGLALTFAHQGIRVSFYERAALSVSIVDPIEETLYDMRSGYSGAIPGVVRPQLHWTINRVS